MLRFLFSTLGYITLFYLLLYFTLNGLINGIESYSAYHLLSGLLVSLLICIPTIAFLYALDIYRLHRIIAVNGALKVQQSGKITPVRYSEIAFFYSENKIVYIVKTDGVLVTTDFNLNKVENKVDEQCFYRANRQTIVHINSIEQVQSIENGKLSVILKPFIPNEKAVQIIISRYKKQEFLIWFIGSL